MSFWPPLRALVLFGGVYVVALLAAAAAVAPTVLLVALVTAGEADLLAVWLVPAGLVVAIPVIGSIAFGLSGIRPPADPTGVEVTRDEAPRLWALVDAMAAELDTAPPRRLLLTAEPNASIGDRRDEYGGRIRTLHLGMPLVVGLDNAELAAVLGHEFGHGRHLWTTRFAARGARMLTGSVRRLALVEVHHRWSRVPAAAVRGLFESYVRFFLYRTAERRRDLELDADRAAARVVGAATVARALSRAHVLGEVWRDHVGEHGFDRTVFTAFGELLAQDWFAELVTALEEDPVEEVPGTYSSHPSLGERLATLNSLADNDLRVELPEEPMLDDLVGLGRRVYRATGAARPSGSPTLAESGEEVAAEHRALTVLAVAIAVVAMMVTVAITGEAEHDRRTAAADLPRSPVGRTTPGYTPTLPPIQLTPLVPRVSLLRQLERARTETVTVRAGDTLTAIACRTLSTVAELMELNHLGTTTIVVGDTLLVPSTFPGLTRTDC